MPPYDNPNVIDVNLSVLGNSQTALTEFVKQLKAINEHMAEAREPMRSGKVRRASTKGGVELGGADPSSRASLPQDAGDQEPNGPSASASTSPKARANTVLGGWTFASSGAAEFQQAPMVSEAIQRKAIQDESDRSDRISTRSLNRHHHGMLGRILGSEDETLGEQAGMGMGAMIGRHLGGGDMGLLLGASAGEKAGPVIDKMIEKSPWSEEQIRGAITNPKVLAAGAAMSAGAAFGYRSGIMPSQIQGSATGLGYAPSQTSIGLGGAGFVLPFSQYFSGAGREGIRQFGEELNLRLKPNISGAQAQEIRQSINEAGYSGSTADKMAFGPLAKLTQQGQDPATVMGLLDKAVRYGNASLQDFYGTMNGLGDVAKATNMNLGQLSQSMDQYAQTAMEHGATYAGGLASGRQFAEQTGMSPEFAAKQMDNPLFQGLAMSRFGLLPQQIGNLPGHQKDQLIAQEIAMATQLTQGFKRPTRDPKTGRIIQTAQDNQDSMIASLTNMSVDELRKMKRGAHRNEMMGRAFDTVHDWGLDAHDPNMDPRDRAALRGPRGHTAWNDVAASLLRAGVSSQEVARISHDSYRDRAREAKQALTKVTDKATEPRTKGTQVEVKFTGKAEKWLEEVGKIVTGKVGPGPVKTAINAGEGFLTHELGGPIGPGIDVAKKLAGIL